MIGSGDSQSLNGRADRAAPRRPSPLSESVGGGTLSRSPSCGGPGNEYYELKNEKKYSLDPRSSPFPGPRILRIRQSILFMTNICGDNCIIYNNNNKKKKKKKNKNNNKNNNKNRGD